MTTKMLTYQGGMNVSTSLGTMPSNQLVSANNVLLMGASLVNRGAPFSLVTPGGTGNKPITSLHYYIDISGNEWFIMGARDSSSNPQIYQMKNDGTTQVATKISTVAVNEPSEYAILNGVLIVAPNGVVPLQWSGSGNLAALGASWTSLNVPAQAVRVVNNFFFMSGSGAALVSSNVYWSNVADATTYNSGNFIAFRQGDGERITALSSIGTDLIIFKPHSVGRLSTQTQILTGAVTLGPLTTICEGIGCSSTKAHDRLPDGRIIFMGSDGNAYIFDGSTFTNISDPAYPASNILGNYISSFNLAGTVSGSVVVRVYEARHEAWFVIVDVTNGSNTFIYDYFNNCWFQKPSTGTGLTNGLRTLESVYSIRTGGFSSIASTTSGVYNRSNALLSGDSNAKVWIEDCGIGPDQSASNPTTQLEFSIPIPGDFAPNVSYFFVLPLKTGSASQTITYYVGQNGTYGSSKTFTTTGGWDRLQITLPWIIGLTSQQVKVTYVTGTTIQFDPAYVSDEALQ